MPPAQKGSLRSRLSRPADSPYSIAVSVGRLKSAFLFCSGARGSYPRTARTPPYSPDGMPRSARSLDSIKGRVSAWLDTSARVCYIIIASSCWQISVFRAHLHFSLRPLSRRAQDVFLFSAFPRGANSVSSSDGIIAAVGSTDTSLQRVSLQLTPLNSARSKGCHFNLHP